MTAAIVQFQKKEDAQFICSACGADRGCNCSAPAVEKLAAMKEDQRKRNRESMQRKRAEESTARVRTHDPVVEGEARKAENAAAEYVDEWDESEIEPDNYYSAYLIRADQAKEFAKYSGQPTGEVVAIARRVARVWSELADKLESMAYEIKA